jgi:hypothetical protein
MCADCLSSVVCEHTRNHSFPVCGSKAVYDRLAAYEDTGLTPEEIVELRKQRHGMTHTRLHSIWRSMRQRCNSPQNKDYKNYGARGITICKEWDSFPAFYDWAMANGYADNLTLDRENNDKGYTPENCRWITNQAQQWNKRCKKITFNGETHTVEEWSKIIGVSNSCIRDRLNRNLPVEKVLMPKGGAL